MVGSGPSTHHNAKVPSTSLSISLRGLPQVHWYTRLGQGKMIRLAVLQTKEDILRPKHYTEQIYHMTLRACTLPRLPTILLFLMSAMVMVNCEMEKDPFSLTNMALGL